MRTLRRPGCARRRRGLSSVARAPMGVLRMSVPVLEQLRLEEALFRADERNWAVLNLVPAGSPGAIVLGISGKPERLVHEEAAAADGVPLIKRFSGGGTVYVDGDCVMVSLLCARDALPGVDAFPRPIMRWSERFYEGVFPPSARFSLQEHDYCIGPRKVGGNAQSIIRGRWLHHTSFLWRVKGDVMERYLKMPDRAPEHRAGRSHADFLAPLSSAAAGREEFCDAVERELAVWFDPSPASVADAAAALALPHDTRTRVLEHKARLHL